MFKYKTKSNGNYSVDAEVSSILANCQEEPSGCMVWKGATNSDGYPKAVRVRVSTGTLDFNVKLHRHLGECVLRSPIDPQVVVRHTCDNPLCLNPAHLVLGTASDNMRDRQERVRTHLQVTKDETQSIFNLNMAGYTGVEIARHLGIKLKRVYYVLKKYKGD